MSSVSLILIVLSAHDIVMSTSDEDTKAFHVESVVAVAVAFGVKFALFLYCSAIRNTYSDVKILWQDHRNDLLINGFGLLTSIAGSKLKWWIDPMRAIIISLLLL